MAVYTKPLGRKAYGSIGHLPGSRMGPGDHACPGGYLRICCEQARDRRGTVIVQEKLDGSCVAVAKIDGALHPLGRAGWPAVSSPHEQHRMFDRWVWDNYSVFDSVLRDGERIVGEWLAQAHGTRYDLSGREPFVAFDIMQDANRMCFLDFSVRIDGKFATPMVLHHGLPLPIKDAMARLGLCGHHGALDPVEGVVYRVERHGRVDFLAKYVRPDKVDGCYLPDVSGLPAVWNLDIFADEAQEAK